MSRAATPSSPCPSATNPPMPICHGSRSWQMRISTPFPHDSATLPWSFSGDTQVPFTISTDFSRASAAAPTSSTAAATAKAIDLDAVIEHPSHGRSGHEPSGPSPQPSDLDAPVQLVLVEEPVHSDPPMHPQPDPLVVPARH